jgi:hypothetical protein
LSKGNIDLVYRKLIDPCFALLKLSGTRGISNGCNETDHGLGCDRPRPSQGIPEPIRPAIPAYGLLFSFQTSFGPAPHRRAGPRNLYCTPPDGGVDRRRMERSSSIAASTTSGSHKNSSSSAGSRSRTKFSTSWRSSSRTRATMSLIARRLASISSLLRRGRLLATSARPSPPLRCLGHLRLSQPLRRAPGPAGFAHHKTLHGDDALGKPLMLLAKLLQDFLNVHYSVLAAAGFGEWRPMYSSIAVSVTRHCLGPNFTPASSPSRRSLRTVATENFSREAVSSTVKCSSINVIVL